MEDKRKKDILTILDALGIETKANEAMHSTQAGYGDEFVPTEMATRVVEKSRDMSFVMSQLPAENIIKMPSNPYDMPVEGGDPTWYNAAEQTGYAPTEYTKSKAGTAKMTFSAAKLAASVAVSAELTEDSIVNIQSMLETKFAKSWAEQLDYMLINGDEATGANTNINLIDGTPTAGTNYLGMDGAIKKAFTDSCTLDVGTLDLADFRAVRKLLGVRGLDPSKLLCVINGQTYYKALSLAQVETIEKAGSMATVVNGNLAMVDGMKVVPTYGALALGNSAGKIPAALGTLGRFVILYMPNVFVGIKREMKIVVEYYGKTDQYIITAHGRADVQFAETGTCAMGFNITV